MPALGFTDPAVTLANATAASSFECGLEAVDPRSSRWLDPLLVTRSLALKAYRREKQVTRSIKACDIRGQARFRAPLSQPRTLTPRACSAGGALVVLSSPLTLSVASPAQPNGFQCRSSAVRVRDANRRTRNHRAMPGHGSRHFD
jgi:hypothetical protein